MKHALTHDQVTGFAMPSFFEQEALQLLSFCQRTHANVALFHIAIKPEDAPEEVFYTLGERLKEKARESDIFARLSPAVFGCLSVETSPDHIELLTDKFQQALSKPVELPDGSSVAVEVKIGVGRFPATSQNFKELMDHARSDLGQ